MMSDRRFILFALASLSLSALSAVTIPKDSKVLGATKGRAFEQGLVFIDGKYIEAPYVVERWGCGIRINKIPVIGEAVPWVEFLKTQTGVSVSKSEGEASPAPAAPAPVAKAPEPASDDLDTSLDDLFDDDPKPAKKTVAKSASSYSAPKPKAAKKTSTVTYKLDGKFVKNAASRALVDKVNALRLEIDRQLRMGGFICFGARYSRISGDKPTAVSLLEKLPGIMRSSSDAAQFNAGVRAAHFEFLTEPLCFDLFRNRIDYRKLQECRQRWKDDAAVEKMLHDAQKPVL